MRWFHNSGLRLCLVISSLVWGLAVHGQVFLYDEGKSFLDSTMLTRTTGIEIEFKGIGDKKINDLILKYYPEASASGSIDEGIKYETSIGTIRVVVEGQA